MPITNEDILERLDKLTGQVGYLTKLLEEVDEKCAMFLGENQA
tara:strand:+ start:195 stop:323 length:129 start_codon:yes stop_codon:yes gene_type:complete